jgi:hypothetical protein
MRAKEKSEMALAVSIGLLIRPILVPHILATATFLPLWQEMNKPEVEFSHA